MDSTDDDFGELYVDDKVQPSDTFAGDVGCEVPESASIPGENKRFEVTVEPESRGESKKLDVMVVDKDSSPCVDDACAVNRTEAKEESEYSDSDSDDDLNIVLKEDDSKAVACGSNWCTVPNSGMVNGRMTMEASSANNASMNHYLGMPHCGYNFSHSWSRTTFDANFHGVEKKPWRNPGMDLNDFFNFGFNEQSWKDYCNPLVKGRAIEVEGGTHGRTPSVDLHRPRDFDSDVVIQIPVTNDVEELSSMAPVEARSLSKTSNKASRSEEFHSDIGEDLHSSGDSIKQEVSVGREDEDSGSIRGEQSPPKENYCSREITPCDKNIIEEEKQETCWSSDKAYSSSGDRDSSLRDHFRCSPTSSYSVGKTEESEDSGTESSKGGATDDQREASTPPRRTRFAEYEANSTKSGEISGSEHSRHRRSQEDSRKRHYGRADYGVHRRTKHANFKDASRTPDPDLGKKVCTGHGRSYRDLNKNWQNRPHYTVEKVGTEGHSNREKRQGRSYSPVDLDRDRGRRLGWRNNKEPSHGRGFDPSNGHKYEEGRKGYTSGSSYQRTSRLSFNKEEDRYGRQHCERRYGGERSPALASESNKEDRYGRQHCERKYSRERSPRLAYESNKERNRYDGIGEPYYQDCIPITDVEYRYRFEYSSTYGRHNPNQSREDELHYRRCDYDYDVPRGRYEDEVHRAERGIPFDLAYREMHSFAEVGRREFERYEEDISEIDRRHYYIPDWHHDRFVSENDGHKYRIQDAWPLPSLPFRDSWQTKGSRGDSLRDYARDFQTREAYDRQNNQLYKDAPRDGWTRNFVHSENVSMQDRLRYDDDDDWGRRGKKRYQLGDSVREVAHPEHRPYTDEMIVPNIGVPLHNRISTKQRPEYFKSHIHEEAGERNQRSKKMRRDGHAFIKCQDPVDVAGRQGKVSNQPKRRFPKGGDTTTEQQDRQKPRNLMGKRNEKAVVQIQGLIEKEEGEIIQEEEERNVTRIVIDKDRIQESIKKMEKRRERFKETEVVAAKFHSQTEEGAKPDVTNQMRPLRKRRWCAAS